MPAGISEVLLISGFRDKYRLFQRQPLIRVTQPDPRLRRFPGSVVNTVMSGHLVSCAFFSTEQWNRQNSAVHQLSRPYNSRIIAIPTKNVPEAPPDRGASGKKERCVCINSWGNFLQRACPAFSRYHKMNLLKIFRCSPFILIFRQSPGAGTPGEPSGPWQRRQRSAAAKRRAPPLLPCGTWAESWSGIRQGPVSDPWD